MAIFKVDIEIESDGAARVLDGLVSMPPDFSPGSLEGWKRSGVRRIEISELAIGGNGSPRKISASMVEDGWRAY